MNHDDIHDRIITARRLAAFGDTWPTLYASDVAALAAAVALPETLDRERLAAIRSRVIDARGSYPWPGGRWAGWYADDATALLEDLPLTV